MKVPLHIIDYSFKHQPIVIGGYAMMYYGLRKAGQDVDLVVAKEDFSDMWTRFPHRRVEKFGEIGIYHKPFEIWPVFRGYTYWQLRKMSHEEGLFRVVSLKMLYTLKMLSATDERLDPVIRQKYAKDLALITRSNKNGRRQKANPMFTLETHPVLEIPEPGLK